MDKEQMKQLNLTSIEDMIAEDFGSEDTATRMEFEAGVDAFILGERLNAFLQGIDLSLESFSVGIRI